jgi:hypothetical protein
MPGTTEAISSIEAGEEIASSPEEHRLLAMIIQRFLKEIIFFRVRNYLDLRNTTSPSTCSESMIDMITASTGVSLVWAVWRADEPAAVSTRSPMPASTVSTAT